MSDPNAVPSSPAAAGGQSLLARIWGILTSPRETFAGVVAYPRWFGMLAVLLIVTAACTGGFLSTSSGQQAWLDQAVRSTESLGNQVTDQQYQAMEKMAPYAGAIAVVQVLFVSPIFMLILAGLLFAVFNAALGGDSSFKQVFTVLVHSSAVTVVQQLFVTPLNVARESMSSATNLAVFLPMLEEGSFLARLLGTIDLFLIWWVIVLSIGLSVLSRRKTGSIAMSLFVVYGVIAIAIAWFTSGRGGA
jgi:hypothetical protein